MDPQAGMITGAGGRRLHVAHRRSPSEMTPLMMEQLALQQQIEMLQQQQSQIVAAHQQYVNMGIIPQQSQVQQSNIPNPLQQQMTQPNQMQYQHQQPHQQQPQHFQSQPVQGLPSIHNPQMQSMHRRGQSAYSMGPPPAPSAGTAGSSLTVPQMGDYSSGVAGNRDPMGSGRGRGAGSIGGGHQRRHSLALTEAKKAAEVAQQKRITAGFQFPLPGAGGASSASSGQMRAPSPLSGGSVSKPLDTNPGLSAHSGNRVPAHGRSQSMAVGSGRDGLISKQSTGELKGDQNGLNRAGSGHNRGSSRNFDANWRQQGNGQSIGQGSTNQINTMDGNQNVNPMSGFQPGHRARGPMAQSLGNLSAFSFPNQQQQLLQQQAAQTLLLQQAGLLGNQQLNPLQIAQLQASLQLQTQYGGSQGMSLQGSQHAPSLSMSSQQSSQAQAQQRKTLFTPYLPQANIPALISNGQLVAGVLRVNKKNRSDAYVTTQDGLLDADIFICGSKDRNRALEGDLVAIELLDVDEVWGQKREKEEKKKRKDINDSRAGGNTGGLARSGSIKIIEEEADNEGGIRRRGSLRQRPTQKKNDDVEVEGQSLLLMEEEDISDEQKPLYAGHVVAVIERIPGQMFSGSLGLLRPSSQATRDKQEAERASREGGNPRHQFDRHQERPKIVWFKPTDKRVPLIAIPTEQAPRDFVERHQDYANRIFVACIKRWPITSLHPFGTLIEQLGDTGDARVETDALLRDNNFGSDEFSEAVLRSINYDSWSVSMEEGTLLNTHRDLRDETIFTIASDEAGSMDNALHVKRLDGGSIEIGFHVADVTHFVKMNSLADREAKKRGTAVCLMDRVVNMLPPKILELCSLTPDTEKLAYSFISTIPANSGRIIDEQAWIGKTIIRPRGAVNQVELNSLLAQQKVESVSREITEQIQTLHSISQQFRATRLDAPRGDGTLRLLQQLDDEFTPLAHNIFKPSPAQTFMEEFRIIVNGFVAKLLAAGLPDQALIRRQNPPDPRRLATFVERMANIGLDLDPSSSASLQNGLLQVEDDDTRKGLEVLLIKSLHRAKYSILPKVPEDLRAHYALNLPLYTHFTNPTRRYADIVVHRQLEAILSNDQPEMHEDITSLEKMADHCNTKKDAAKNAQEQSIHIEQCRIIDARAKSHGADLVTEAVVICVYESAFDVVIPEFGFEKRVHCDQLPLKKAEFDKNKRILELYWEKDCLSSAYIPEDERPKPTQLSRSSNFDRARDSTKEREDAQRRVIDTGSRSAADVDALFDDEDEEPGQTATAQLTAQTKRFTLEDTGPVGGAPTTVAKSRQLNGAAFQSVGARLLGAKNDNSPESKGHAKKKYEQLFKLRQSGKDLIQDVTELCRVPVILKTDLTKSPPCLTIRSVNPYAM